MLPAAKEQCNEQTLSYTMRDMLKKIIRDSGVDVIDMYSDTNDSGEYVLTYGRTRKLCLGFDDTKDDVYYQNVAWSCFVDCYLVIGNDACRLYSPLITKYEEYSKDKVLNNIEKFFGYVGRYALKPTQRIFAPLFKETLKYYEELEDKAAYNPNDLSKLWSDDAPAPLTVGINGNTIQAVPALIRRHVIPTFLDAVALIFTTGENKYKQLQSVVTSGLVFLDTFRMPSYVIRNIIHNRLAVRKDGESVLIFNPFTWSTAEVIECVRELRRKGFAGVINIESWLLNVLDSRFFSLAIDLLEDKNLNIEFKEKIGLKDAWTANCDYIIALPPYKLMERQLLNFNNKEAFKAVMGYDDCTDIPFEIANRASNVLGENGRIVLSTPTHLMKSADFLEKRNTLLQQISPVTIQHIGSYIMQGFESLSSMIAIKREANMLEHTVSIFWCDDTANGFDEAMRANNQSRQGALLENVENRKYNIQTGNLKAENLAPRPYSENLAILEYQNAKDSKTFLPAERLFTISSCAVTGMNELFMVTAEQFHTFDILEKTFFKPVICSQSICEGTIQDERMLFFPYNEEGCMIHTKKEMLTKLPSYGKYFLEMSEAMLNFRTRQKEQCAWEYAYWRKVHLPGRRRFACKSYGSKGSFVLDASGQHVVVSGYQWVPLKRLDKDDILYAYLAIFSSDFFWKVVDGIAAKSHSSATKVTYKLTKESIGSIPLPDLSSPVFAEYLGILSHIGQQIALEGIQTIDDNLNSTVYRIYNGEQGEIQIVP